MKLYTTEEMMKFFGVTRGTIYNWRKKGLPIKKIGGTVRFDIDEVNEWIEKEQIKG